jgi:hypothetical protein
VLVGIDAVSVMAAYRPVVQACGELHACTTGRYAAIYMAYTNTILFHYDHVRHIIYRSCVDCSVVIADYFSSFIFLLKLRNKRQK